MACPRGYRGRHTGLYRDTEGKQPRARNLRTKFQAPKSAPRAATTAARGGRWESLQATAVKGPGTHGQ